MSILIPYPGFLGNQQLSGSGAVNLAFQICELTATSLSDLVMIPTGLFDGQTVCVVAKSGYAGGNSTVVQVPVGMANALFNLSVNGESLVFTWSEDAQTWFCLSNTNIAGAPILPRCNTTDGTTWVTLLPIPLQVSQAVYVNAMIAGVRTDGGNAGNIAYGNNPVIYQRIGSAAPTLNSNFSATFAAGVSDTTLSTVAFRFTVSGNVVLLQCKGAAGASVSWALVQVPAFFYLPD